MSVHSNRYETEEEYIADLQFEYRAENKSSYFESMSCHDCSCSDECRKEFIESDQPKCEIGMDNIEMFEQYKTEYLNGEYD